jgi:hypothetical protein
MYVCIDPSMHISVRKPTDTIVKTYFLTLSKSEDIFRIIRWYTH